MATEVIMPKAGMAMERGTVIQWFKKPGEYVEAGEPLLEIETDKVAMEVEAEVSGYLLKTLYHEGDEVDVITTIGYIGEKGETPPDVAEGSATAEAPTETTVETGSTLDEFKGGSNDGSKDGSNRDGSAIRATPAARFLARRSDISLSSLSGTGKWGEIRKRDVEAAEAGAGEKSRGSADRISPVARALAEQHRISTAGIAGSGPGGRVVKQDVLGALAQKDGSTAPAASRRPDTPLPLTGMRKTISRRMTESHQTIPPVTMNKKVDVTALFSLRKQVNQELDEPISLTPFFVRAVALSLAEAPYMRTTLEESQLVERGNIDIGIAVALDDGLLVPVLPSADTLSVGQIHRRAQDLINRARDRKLTPDELTGSVFSITNLGMYGISSFTPIINPPETAILGLNAAEDELYLDEGEVRSRKVLTLSLTIDHRVIDGAQGALFLKILEGYLSKPLRLLV